MQDIHYACRNGDLEEASRIVKRDESRVNLQDGDGNTPIIYAVLHVHAPLVEWLIRNGADVTHRCVNQDTALYIACHKNSPEIVRLLLNGGAASTVHVCGWNHACALTSSVYRDHEECLRLLLECAETDVDRRDSYGSTAAWLASRYGHPSVLDRLLRAGADPMVINDDTKTALDVCWSNHCRPVLHEWFILYNVYKAHKQSKKVVVSQYWKDCVASAVVSHVVHRIPAELFKEMRLLFYAMEKNQEGAVNQPFSRTTSNSFVSPSQYVLIESAPIESDRAVLIRIRDFVAGSQQETTASGIPSLIDPFLTTLTKDKKALLECNDFLWKTVLQRFGLETSGPLGQPQRLPKKVIIQLQNTLRRLRDPSDTTSLRPTEHVEIQVAWHLRRIQQTKDVSLWVKSILALQCLSLPATYSTYVDTFLQKFISPKAEYIWETLTVNEHLLWSSRRRIELYATQQKLLAEVKKPEPAIIQLATPPCTGKTLMAAGLMTASPSMTLVFCCISPGVYLHVARLLYHLGIWPTFIFGDRKIEPNFKISRVSWDPRMLTPASQYLKTVIPTARAFIVDFNLCHWFLRQLDPTKDILLFLDEPTMGADGCEAFVHVPALLATILKSEHLPAKVVLSSATLPSAEDMVPLIAPWHRKYPDGRVVRIDDAILTSSISLVSMETGHLELPHASCETIHDLSRLISRIGSDIVLLKAYSGLAVHLMREAHKVVYGTCPTFEDAGISWKDLEIMSLRRYAIYMLEAVSRDFRQEFCAWKPRVPTFPCLDISKIALEFSPYVPGQTLIVSRTTEVLARSIVDPLIAERKLRHLEGALQQEVQSKKMFEEQSKKIKDKEERQMYDESQEFHRAVQFVPDELVIHTAAHLRRYGGDGAQKRFPKEFIRRPPPSGIVRQVLNAKAEEWLKHSFLAGVMYTDVRMHTQTSSLVGLMEASLMDGIPIAAVDRSFSYGVNVPASNVVINEDAAEDMSYNSIVQFINRVARLAGTDAGRAFLCKLAMQKLLNGDDGQEARVLHEAMMK